MQTLSENKRNNDSNDTKKPSLLRQIVDKVDLLTEVEQHQLLLQLNKDELLAKAEEIDKKFKGAFKKMTEEEVTLMVSKDRKKNYEKPSHH